MLSKRFWGIPDALLSSSDEILQGAGAGVGAGGGGGAGAGGGGGGGAGNVEGVIVCACKVLRGGTVGSVGGFMLLIVDITVFISFVCFVLFGSVLS